MNRPMIKTWTQLLLLGFVFSAFICGLVLGGSLNPTMFLAAVLMTFLPLIVGIHAGVSFMREEKSFDPLISKKAEQKSFDPPA